MQQALKSRPARPFVRPRNAIFRTVNGVEEAFRPGTERQREEQAPVDPALPVGPQSYNDVVRRELESGGETPATAPPTAVPPPPQPQRPPAEDLSGLY